MSSIHRSPARKRRAQKPNPRFDPKTFLAQAGFGRTIQHYRPKQTVFLQGEPSDAVFYIQEGKVRLSVLSKQGKEATIALLGAGDFLGEGCIASDPPARMATATALTDCDVMKIEKMRWYALSTRSTDSPICLWHMWWNVTTVHKWTWSINFSIQAKNGWRGRF